MCIRKNVANISTICTELITQMISMYIQFCSLFNYLSRIHSFGAALTNGYSRYPFMHKVRRVFQQISSCYVEYHYLQHFPICCNRCRHHYIQEINHPLNHQNCRGDNSHDSPHPRLQLVLFLRHQKCRNHH